MAQSILETIWVQYGALGILLAVLIWTMMRREADLKEDHERKKELLDTCNETNQLCLEQLMEQRKDMLAIINDTRDQIQTLHQKQVNVIENNTKVIGEVVEAIRQCRK